MKSSRWTSVSWSQQTPRCPVPSQCPLYLPSLGMKSCPFREHAAGGGGRGRSHLSLDTRRRCMRTERCSDRRGGQMDNMQFQEGSMKESNRDETYTLHRFLLSFLLKQQFDRCLQTQQRSGTGRASRSEVRCRPRRAWSLGCSCQG